MVLLFELIIPFLVYQKKKLCQRIETKYCIIFSNYISKNTIYRGFGKQNRFKYRISDNKKNFKTI